MNIDIELPEKAQVLLKPKRFKVLMGGRGSAKSASCATVIIARCLEKTTRVLCTRQYQMSIKESVIKILADTITRLGVDSLFTVTNSGIKAINGSEILFEGLHNNVSKIKSMEGVDIVWAEEADAITEDSWQVLIPTIRKDDSEIWVVFNAQNEIDATYIRFIPKDFNEYFEDDIHYVVKMNYSDNPWFPEELRKDMERMKESDYQKYLHVYEGEPVGASDKAIIKPLWIRAAIDAHIKLGWKGRGIKALGFDPADEGQDNKGIVVRHGSLVTLAKSWTTGDITTAVEEAFSTAKEHNVTDFVYDAVGVGAAVKQALTTLEGRDRFTVTGFRGNDIPDNPKELYRNDRANHDVFRNRRAQAFWLLRDRFEATYNAVVNGIYTDPEELISLDSRLENLTELTSELSRVERKTGTRDLIQLESKADMRKRGFKSPGLADSICYAFATPALDPHNWNTPLNYNHSGVV